MRTRTLRLMLGAVITACLPALSIATAQTLDKRALETEWAGRVLHLRGQYMSDDLRFNAQGELQGSAEAGPFYLSAMEIKGFDFQDGLLKIHGYRFALAVANPQAKVLSIKALGPLESVKIKVELDPAHPELLEAALEKIFARNPHEALMGETPEQQQKAFNSLASLTPETPQSLTADKQIEIQYGAIDLGKKAGPVQIPRLLHSIDPSFPVQAQQHRIGGLCRFQLVVGVDGRPRHIRIVKALPGGLTESAIEAISQYRFAPATRDGQPVPAIITIVVDFHVL